MAQDLGICCWKLPVDVADVLRGALDRKRNVIRPSCRRDVIRIVRDVLKLDPLSGVDLHKVWPSLKSGPISNDPQDYVVRRAGQYIPVPKGKVREPEVRGSGTDWSRLIFSTIYEIGEERSKANKSVRSFIKRAGDETAYPEATEIREEFRRAAIDFLANVLNLDPLNGLNILRVWPHHKNKPISTDSADYMPMDARDRPYTIHPATHRDYLRGRWPLR